MSRSCRNTNLDCSRMTPGNARGSYVCFSFYCMLQQTQILKLLQDRDPSYPEVLRCGWTSKGLSPLNGPIKFIYSLSSWINSPAEGLGIPGWKLLISLKFIRVNELKESHSSLQVPTVQPPITPKFLHHSLPPLLSHRTGTIELSSFSPYFVRQKLKFNKGERRCLM